MIKKYITETLKWSGISALTGVSVGLVGIAFHWTLEQVREVQTAHHWVVWFLSLAGLAIVFLYKILGFKKDDGTNAVLKSAQTGEKVTIRMTIAIFISTAITHLFGGSAGREGAALQIGGSIANKIGRSIHLSKDDMRMITVCGMGAGFSALFGTPATSTVFALEIANTGEMCYPALLPCMISSVVASSLAKCFGFAPTAFLITEYPEISVENFIRVALLAFVVAFVAMLFYHSTDFAKEFFQKKFKNPYIRIMVGGVIISLLSPIFGYVYNGAGTDTIVSAFQGQVGMEKFLLKIIFTAITLGSGFKGGEIVPTLFIGSTFGSAFAWVFGLNPSFSAGIAMIAMFCGVTNCPIASMVLAVELFADGKSISFFIIACAISYAFSGKLGLYSAQKIFHKGKLEI